MNFLEKLDFFMDRYALNKRTLSQKSKIPYTTIDNWYKRGYKGLKIPTLCKLSEFFDTTLDYWVIDEITDPDCGRPSGFKIEYEEVEHIENYRKLDAPGKVRIDYELNKELARIEQLQAKQDHIEQLEQRIVTELIHRISIPLYAKFASAGSGAYLFDDIPTDMIEVEDTPTARQADFAIGVDGRSMEPDYYDGEKVFVRKTSDLNIGDVGIFLKGEKCYLKELGKDRLISHNPDKKDYPDIKADETITVVGKVLGKVE